MNRIKKLWAMYGGWMLVCIPVVLIAACLAVHAAKPMARTIAEPPIETEVTFDMEVNRAYTAEDGIVVIGDIGTPIAAAPGIGAASITPAITEMKVSTPAAKTVKAGGKYTLPENVQMADGSIGLLTIPKLALSVNVYETDDEMEAMTHGLAHFKTTSAWEGNVGLAGHNVNFDLTDGYLKNLHKLKIGDTIRYQTALGTKTYTVETIAEIAETDWSYLGRTEDNRITLITCISGKPASRLVVQAMEKS